MRVCYIVPAQLLRLQVSNTPGWQGIELRRTGHRSNATVQRSVKLRQGCPQSVRRGKATLSNDGEGVHGRAKQIAGRRGLTRTAVGS